MPPLGALFALRLAAADPVTERQYLSGQGPDDAVAWDFTVSAGRRAGEATTIPVPSHWELQGFGTYNYGQVSSKSDEQGLYRTRFRLPAEWKGRRVRLVFGGVMTDTTALVNGRSAGPTHQGGFTQFRYDITRLVKFGAGATDENKLEVTVAKVSANAAAELAERGGDYWVFGGIYRPVWIEALPALAIDRLAIDARADGTIAADVILSALPTKSSDGLQVPRLRIEASVLDREGKSVGPAMTQPLPAGGSGSVRLSGRVPSPRLWTAETPHLHRLRVELRSGDELIHVFNQTFGFRTFEVRDGEGLFLNGTRIRLKGVNRHSFRPVTGRALSRADCYADARLIRSLNMNAVRMSHYPPDAAFLEACDELGLYVLDELPGWHAFHDTGIGRQLVREMLERDVNHPSILFWDNGNETGFNRDLDPEFALLDPQRRRVLHPWDTFSGIDTKHYMGFEDYALRLRGPNLVMPTEILHGLYDGGAGAGLEDYWNAALQSPFGAGLFIWSFADEGVVRTDQAGRIDVFGTFAPDGIVGPHGEREGSYDAVRDIWCPVQIQPPKLDATFSGTLSLRNDYDFLDLQDCRFAWKLHTLAPGKPIAEGTVVPPPLAPHASGPLTLALPATWSEADRLEVVATDPVGNELRTWSWPIAAGVARRRDSARPALAGGPPGVERNGDRIRLSTGAVKAEFDVHTGRLRALSTTGKDVGLRDGPRLVAARPAAAGATQWFATAPTGANEQRFAAPTWANAVEVGTDLPDAAAYAAFTLELSNDGATWRTVFRGARRANDGKAFEFPPQRLMGVRVSQLHDEHGRPLHVKQLRTGFAAARFALGTESPFQVTAGVSESSGTTAAVAWVEARGGASEHFRWALRADGSLSLQYDYTLEGEFLYHGVTFDLPPDTMTTLRWVGAGPNPVWKNRLRGTTFGAFETVPQVVHPGESWRYPLAQGYFAGVEQAEFALAETTLQLSVRAPESFLRIGTPALSHPRTTVDFPPGDLSFLAAIPAIGSKFKSAEQSGPSGQPSHASGRYSGQIVFRLVPR